jgi:hypothetical protein
MTQIGPLRKHCSAGSVAIPGSGAFFTPGSGMEKKIRDPGKNIPESLETGFNIKNT